MAARRLRESVATSELPQLERGQDTEPELQEAGYSLEHRITLANLGRAIPVRDNKGRVIGGRYPIEDAQDVRNAVEDAIRTKAGGEVRAHIVKQAKRIGPGAEKAVPADWTRSKPKKAKRGKRQPTAARESTRFVARLHEAEVRKDGTAYEATIIREGPGNSNDRNAYSRDALRKAVSDGLFEGLQCYANHPTASEERERPERDVRQLVGHFREARYVEDGGRGQVRAKFVPITGPGYEWVTSLIESALTAPAGRPLIGISIDGEGYAPDQEDIGGHTYNVVREVTHLGSADIVTRAGAGGQFHRRLSESLAGARESVTDGPKLTVRQLQKQVREALRRLESGLADESDERVRGAFVSLQEAASASVKVPASGAPSRAEVEKLKKRAEKAEKRCRLAESRAELLDRAKIAGRLLREVDVPGDTREVWFDELSEQPDEPAMRRLLARRLAERRQIRAELRESMGLDLVEGNPPRQPSGLPQPGGRGGLLERMGIDTDELEAA